MKIATPRVGLILVSKMAIPPGDRGIADTLAGAGRSLFEGMKGKGGGRKALLDTAPPITSVETRPAGSRRKNG